MNGSLGGGGRREVAPLTLSAMAEATEATRTRTRPVLPTLPSFFPLVTLFPCNLSTAFSWQLDRKLHGKREREGEISEDIAKGKGRPTQIMKFSLYNISFITRLLYMF